MIIAENQSNYTLHGWNKIISIKFLKKPKKLCKIYSNAEIKISQAPIIVLCLLGFIGGKLIKLLNYRYKTVKGRFPLTFRKFSSSENRLTCAKT